MPDPSAQPRRTGRPPRISREQLVATTNRIIESEGVEKVTMRRLASEVGATPMALYHHVRDKKDLLLLVLNDLAEGLPRPVLPADPRERIIATAELMHDALAGRPWVVEVITTDDLFSPTGLWFNENIIDAAITYGLTPERAAHAYMTIWSYTVGDVVVQSRAAKRRAAGDRPHMEEVLPELDPEQLPRMAALADRWPALSAEDTYRHGIRALVDGLLAALDG